MLFSRGQTMLIQYPAKRGGGYIIPDDVTRIGNAAFCDSFGLISVTIPHGVTNIEGYAFCYCKGLTNIIIPSTSPVSGNGGLNNAWA